MTRWSVVALGLAAAVCAQAADGPAIGTILGPDTAAQAEKLLPPEILSHYQKGEYVNEIVDWPAEGGYTWPTDFKAASEGNEGKYVIAQQGHIVSKGTAEQPAYIFGLPFPKIDAKDPTAGSQIVWNTFYRTWYFGNLEADSQINMIGEKQLERRLDVTASAYFYDGLPKADLPPNPDNLQLRQLSLVHSPADVNGTAALTWRYREPGKRDSTWAFVPALRRVRATSPANRSDGFLGSDFAQDDGTFFEGKPEDFEWKLVGEADQLRIVDPFNLKGQSKVKWVQPGGWDTEWPDLKFIGYMDPEWKGVGWAPRTAALAKRPMWLVEGVPKDKYYLFGKLLLYIDKVSYNGSWNRKFDWRGNLLNTYQVMGYNPHMKTRPDGQTDWVQGSNMAYQLNESLSAHRATAAGIKTHPINSKFVLRAVFDPKMFELDTLARSGK